MGKNTAFLDKNGRLFGKLSIIDLLVLLLIVCLTAAIIYRFSSSSMTKDSTCTMRYTLMIESVRDFTLEYYQEGLTCFDKLKQEYIGTIAAVRSESNPVPVPQLDGSVVVAEQPNALRIYVDIECDARETDSSYLLNGAYELKVGSQVNLNTKYIDVMGMIVSFEVIR